MTTARPLLMSGPMVRSTIEGIKTKTRRIVKGDPVNVVRLMKKVKSLDGYDEPSGEFGICSTHAGVISKNVKCPYGKPGDLLWVRERAHYGPDRVAYSADNPALARGEKVDGWGPARPSIHMPRWASRLTLELTDVRVERLQDISKSDVEAEGIEYAIRPFGDWKLIPGIWDFEGLVNDGEQRGDPPPAIKYAYLWNSINAKAGTRWADNPWVWVLTFKVHHANVDAVLAQLTEVAT